MVNEYQRSAAPTASAHPAGAESDGSQNPRTEHAIPLESRWIAELAGAHAAGRGQPAPAAAPSRAHDRTPRPARIPPLGRKAAALLASGTPIGKAAASLGCNESTLWRWQRAPWWADASRLARATVAADTESEMAAGRLEAVRALRRVVAPPDDAEVTADPNEVSSAARALLAASAPPGELTRARARAEARADLAAALRLEPAEIRDRILARFDGDTTDLSAFTPEQLLERAGIRP